MKTLKKFLCVLPCIFLLIISSIPFSAYAASHSSSVSGWGYTGSGSERYYPPSAFGFSESDKYLIVTYTFDDGDWSYNTSVAFDFTGQNGSFSVGADGSLNYTGGFHVSQPKVYFKKNDASGSAWESGNKKITFNPSTGSINYEFDGYYGSYISKFTLLKYETNIPEFDDSMKVNVTFKPNLSGEIDRKVSSSSGETGLSESFSMSVENLSSGNIQYKMYIYNNLDEEVFRYMAKEWVYSFDLNHAVNATHTFLSADKVALQYKPSYVHLVTSKEVDTQIIKWCQLPLDENAKYTVVVEAAPIDLDLASEIYMGNGDNSYVIRSDNYEEVFRSSFYVSNLSGVSFNPDDFSNGLIPATPDNLNELVNQRDAIKYNDGTFDFKNYNSFADPNSPYNKYGDGVGTGNNYTFSGSYSGGSSNFNFRNLLASSSSFFSFLSASLGYFPPVLLDCVGLALLSFIVLAIVRRLH